MKNKRVIQSLGDCCLLNVAEIRSKQRRRAIINELYKTIPKDSSILTHDLPGITFNKIYY